MDYIKKNDGEGCFMLTVKYLTKKYDNFMLNDISFSLKEGRITGFIGMNGSGKTTVLKCILGVVPYETGKISIGGLTALQNEQEYKGKIGVVFDSGCFYDELTLEAMTSIIAEAYGSWDENIYSRYMERFGLSRTQQINTLSRGMKMKYSLALALSHHAELLILDDPFSGLDPKTRPFICEELLAQKEEGKTILLSVNTMSDIDKICDDIVFIHNGTILRECSRQEFLMESVKNPPTVEDVMMEIISRRGK